MGFRKHVVNKKNFFNRPVWRNSVGNIVIHPLAYYEPENLDDLTALVNEAIAAKLPIRAVGAGHSYSSAPHTNGLLVDTSLLSRNLGPYPYTSKSGDFIEFESGIRLKQLNKELDKLNLALPTMGGIDHMALAGALQTGTHGSNLTLGAMSQMVRSILLVTHDPTREGAKVYRIEKSDGLTDKNTYPPEAPELIQDDDVFHSVVVSFGTMGIIYAVVLAVERLFYLEERKQLDSWENIKTQLQKGLLAQHYSVYILVNPYPVKGKLSALLAYSDRTGSKSKRTLILEDMKRKFLHRIDRAMRNPISQLLGNFPLTYWLFVWLINRFPHRIPHIINRALRTQQDKTYVNKSYKVMYQGLDYLKERAYDAEFAIYLEQDKYLVLLDDLFVLLQHLHNKYRFQLSSPIELRFIKQSEVFLTPEYGKDVCYIGTPVLKPAYGNGILLYHIQQLFMKHGARPHWGKMNEHVEKEYIQKVYPRFNDWLIQFKRFNPNGIFSNRFSRQMVE